MASLLEKITLYDLLGYLLPGCVLNMLIEYAFQGKIHKFTENIFGGETSFEWFLFLLLSYVEGIILSEISRNLIRASQKRKNIRKKNQLGYDNEQIATVLAAYQNSDKKPILQKLDEGNGRDLYAPIIYGDIQVDSNFNRIHNYASAETMYKNLAMALVVGMVILETEKMLTINLAFVLIVGVVVLIRRCRRFADKKEQYSLVWFMEKYSKMVR